MQADTHDPDRRRAPYAKDDALEALFDAMNLALADASLPLTVSPRDATALPLVYIVGAPRSGTTLLSQLLSRMLPVGYINNLIARFWRRPAVGIALSEVLLGPAARATIALESTHGVSPGVAGPHEFGYFWRHWLPLDRAATHHLSAQELATVDAAGLRHALEQEILGAFGRPVLFKNVICGFHAAFLTGLHARSLFLHIERDAFDTCCSVLKTRAERYGSYDAWWSLRPSTYPFGTERGDAAAEVARQVLDCRREIEVELNQPGVRALRFGYEQLCANPASVIDAVRQEVAALGAELAPEAAVLPRLRAAPAPRLPAPLEQRLRDAIDRAARGTD